MHDVRLAVKCSTTGCTQPRAVSTALGGTPSDINWSLNVVDRLATSSTMAVDACW